MIRSNTDMNSLIVINLLIGRLYNLFHTIQNVLPFLHISHLQIEMLEMTERLQLFRLIADRLKELKTFLVIEQSIGILLQCFVCRADVAKRNPFAALVVDLFKDLQTLLLKL